MSEAKEEVMYLYVIACNNDWIKVGKSINPEQRLYNMKTDNPYPLELITKLEYDDDEYDSGENKLRAFLAGPGLAKDEIHREWFRVPDANRFGGGFQTRLRTLQKALDEENELALEMIFKFGWTYYAHGREAHWRLQKMEYME